ncbi:MAG: hypothetical protein K0Q46_5352 [Rhodococcus erythropolis]|jgi:hypothetical protein|nr:hypothetical protein [Rhodococcus erythropolis]
MYEKIATVADDGKSLLYQSAVGAHSGRCGPEVACKLLR